MTTYIARFSIGRAIAAVAVLLLLLVGTAGLAQPLGQAPLGQAPTYAPDRVLGSVPPKPLPNEQAIDHRIWVPGLDDGYVPQGLAVDGDSVYVAAYLPTKGPRTRSRCRLFRVDTRTGSVAGSLDLPPSCGHAGGLALVAPDRIWVVDTRVMHEVALSTSPGAALGQVLREVRLQPPLKGSLATATPGTVWLGSYERGQPGRLYAIPEAAITGPRLGVDSASRSLELPSRAQGAAFDAASRLWVSRSGSKLGQLVVLDGATGAATLRYRVPDGVEGLAFAGDRLWTVSEAGSRLWSHWQTFFPLVIRLDPARLR